MENQGIKYPTQVVKAFTGVVALKDSTATNYLKGPQLVDIFESLGFADNYSYSNGIGIQTPDVGENLSRTQYVLKRLEILNNACQLPRALKRFLEVVPNQVQAVASMKEITDRYRLPAIFDNPAEALNDALKPASIEQIEYRDAKPGSQNLQIAFPGSPLPGTRQPSYIADQVEHHPTPMTLEEQVLGKLPTNRPIVFISYSWDSDAHSAWVLKLAEGLTKNGIHVLLDKYVPSGTNLSLFMTYGIQRAAKVLIIGSERYKQKSEVIGSGAAFEGFIINVSLYTSLGSNKFLPCLRTGNFGSSFPLLIKDGKGYDFTNDSKFEEVLDALCHDLWDRPIVKRPTLGDIPDYAKN